VIQGKSLVPLLKGPVKEWHYPAFTQVQRRVQGGKKIMGRSIRTDKWRYTEWGEGEYGVELYDHDNDSNEFTNLAKEPQYVPIVAKLKKLLHENYRSL
jgi:uncharacterized sulfatase